MESVTIADQQVLVYEESPDVDRISKDIAEDQDQKGIEDAFMVYNLDEAYERYKEWKTRLPMVQPFYAVKCNPDPVLLRHFAALNTGFDCASQEEISQILSLGVRPDRIVYSNTCKSPKSLEFVHRKKVQLTIFDNLEELEKIAKYHPNAEVLLRVNIIETIKISALTMFSRKFGAHPTETAPKLLEDAKRLNVNVVGISFHAGRSHGYEDTLLQRRAIEQAVTLFQKGDELGFKMSVLNIGGGFPTGQKSDTQSFEKVSTAVDKALKESFPMNPPRFIAEPGRFFAATVVTLITKIISAYNVNATEVTEDYKDREKTGMMYYINDSLYGSFICRAFNHAKPVGEPLHEKKSELLPTTIWGPTCNGSDLIEDKKLMRRLELGDWMKYPLMGAYTSTAASTFNGFSRPRNFYVIGKETYEKIFGE